VRFEDAARTRVILKCSARGDESSGTWSFSAVKLPVQASKARQEHKRPRSAPARVRPRRAQERPASPERRRRSPARRPTVSQRAARSAPRVPGFLKSTEAVSARSTQRESRLSATFSSTASSLDRSSVLGSSLRSSGAESPLARSASRSNPWARADFSSPSWRAEEAEWHRSVQSVAPSQPTADWEQQDPAEAKRAEERLAAALRRVGTEHGPSRRALEELAQAAAVAARFSQDTGRAVDQQASADRARDEPSAALPRVVPEEPAEDRRRKRERTHSDPGEGSRPIEVDLSSAADRRSPEGQSSPAASPRSTGTESSESRGVAESRGHSRSGPQQSSGQHSEDESTDPQWSGSESSDPSSVVASSRGTGVRRLHKGSTARSVHYEPVGRASRHWYRKKGVRHSTLNFEVREKPRSSAAFSRKAARRTPEERILLTLLWLVNTMSKSPTAKSTTKKSKKAAGSDGMSTKAKQWEAVRRELETKVTSLQDELSGMRKWCLAALGEAEKRTAELRSQNAATQRQLVEETQRKIEAIQAAEANLHKLQEEKKLKLMVYGQTLTKHKEMAEEADELQQQLEDENAAREDAERRVADAEAEVEHLQSQLAHLEREFQLQLTQHHETTAANTEEYEAQIQTLTEERSTAVAAQAQLEQQAQVAEESRRSMETHIADLEAASNIKDHQLKDLRAAVERLNGQVDDHTEVIRKTETEKHDMSLALSREQEAQRHLSERVNHLTRDTEAHGARSREFEDKHDDVHAQLTAANAALREERSKREAVEAQVVRLSAHSDLPDKVLSTEKAMHALQIKLGATEASLEVANSNVATWKGDHARLKEDTRKIRDDLEATIKETTSKNEAKIAELTEALDAEQDKTNRLERETVRLNEESTRLQELRDKQDGQVESLSTQVQDLRRSVSDKDAEITKFNATAKQLSQHIAELETNATKSGHLIETTAGEKQRLTDELKVATQQLDMMREVTRQLYAKITEQVRRVRTMIAL
jgi:predicted  nucleic acid-binding Zn-ribbon protein